MQREREKKKETQVQKNEKKTHNEEKRDGHEVTIKAILGGA